jgi:hypothetical protein
MPQAQLRPRRALRPPSLPSSFLACIFLEHESGEFFRVLITKQYFVLSIFGGGGKGK